MRLSFYHDNFEYHRYDNYKFDPYNSIKNCMGFIVDSQELKYDRCLPYFVDDIIDNVDYQIKKSIFIDNTHCYINDYLEDHIYRKLGQSQVLGMYFEALVKTMFVNEDVHCIECSATDGRCMPVRNNTPWCDVFCKNCMTIYEIKSREHLEGIMDDSKYDPEKAWKGGELEGFMHNRVLQRMERLKNHTYYENDLRGIPPLYIINVDRLMKSVGRNDNNNDPYMFYQLVISKLTKIEKQDGSFSKTNYYMQFVASKELVVQRSVENAIWDELDEIKREVSRRVSLLSGIRYYH